MDLHPVAALGWEFSEIEATVLCLLRWLDPLVEGQRGYCTDLSIEREGC